MDVDPENGGVGKSLFLSLFVFILTSEAGKRVSKKLAGTYQSD